MEFKNILFEKKDHVGIITINRPEVLNAFDTQTVNEMRDCFNAMKNDFDIRCVVITGTGRSFVAGGDIYEEEGLSIMQFNDFCRNGLDFTEMIEDFRVPVIAAINGFALGGGLEVAVACDMRIASEKAKLGFPEVTLGVIPGWGGTQRCAKLTGPAWAKRLVCTGEKISADIAKEIGLVEEVVPAEELMNRVLQIAAMITDNPPYAVELGKKSVASGAALDPHRGVEIELGNICQLKSTEDCVEGYAAFVEKRPHKPYNRK